VAPVTSGGANVEVVELWHAQQFPVPPRNPWALLAHKVLFFRNQHDLDDHGQLAFASKLGTPTTAHPTLSRGATVLPIDSRYDKANSWHTDVTFVDRIPKRLSCGPFRCPVMAEPPHGRRPRRPMSNCPRRCARSPRTSGRCTRSI